MKTKEFALIVAFLLIVTAEKIQAQCNTFQFIEQPPINLPCNPFDTKVTTPVWRLRTFCKAQKLSGSQTFDVHWFHRKTNGEVEDLMRPEVWTSSDNIEEVYFGNNWINQQFNTNMLGEYWCQIIVTSEQPNIYLGISNVFTIDPPESYTASRCSQVVRVSETLCADFAPTTSTPPLLLPITSTPTISSTSSPIVEPTTTTTSTPIISSNVEPQISSLPTSTLSSIEISSQNIISTRTISSSIKLFSTSMNVETILPSTILPTSSSIIKVPSNTMISSLTQMTSILVATTLPISTRQLSSNTQQSSLVSMTTILPTTTMLQDRPIPPHSSTPMISPIKPSSITHVLVPSRTPQGNERRNDESELLLTASIAAIVMLLLIIILLIVIVILVYVKPRRKRVVVRSEGGQFFQMSSVRSDHRLLDISGSSTDSATQPNMVSIDKPNQPTNHRYSTISAHFNDYESHPPVVATSSHVSHIYDDMYIDGYTTPTTSNQQVVKPLPPPTTPPPLEEEYCHYPSMYDEYEVTPPPGHAFASRQNTILFAPQYNKLDHSNGIMGSVEIKQEMLGNKERGMFQNTELGEYAKLNADKLQDPAKIENHLTAKISQKSSAKVPMVPPNVKKGKRKGTEEDRDTWNYERNPTYMLPPPGLDFI